MNCLFYQVLMSSIVMIENYQLLRNVRSPTGYAHGTKGFQHALVTDAGGKHHWSLSCLGI